MITKRNLLILFLLLLVGWQAGMAQNRPIGVNLADIGPFSSQIMFKDVMKQSGSWIAMHSDMSDFFVDEVGGVPVNIQLTSDGYPVEAPFIVNGDTLLPHLTILNQQPAPWYYPSGNYSLIFEGNGTVMIDWDIAGGIPQFYSQANVTHSVPVQPSQWGLHLTILQSDPMDPIRNIRLILPGHESTYEAEPFLPEFLTLLQPFEALRFMKPQALEENAISTWNERTLTNYYHYWSEGEGQVREGLPYEYVIRLCNETQKDLWLTIPYSADNDFVDSLATMMRDSLDPGRSLYLEYSNETWNPNYPVTHDYVNSMGVAMNLHADTMTAGQYYHVLRSIEIFERFETIFAGQTQRLYNVISSQAWDVPGAMIVNALGDPQVNPNGFMPDALSVAPYFGAEVLDNIIAQGLECAVDEQNVLDSLQYGMHDWMNGMVAPFRYWADSLGIDLVSYEGGQYLGTQYSLAPQDSCSMTNNNGANRDARMEDVYCQFYSEWYDTLGGNLHLAFVLCESYGAYGAHGLVESVWQDPLTSPKYIAQTSCFMGAPLATNEVILSGRENEGMLSLEWAAQTSFNPAWFEIECGHEGKGFRVIDRVEMTNYIIGDGIRANVNPGISGLVNIRVVAVGPGGERGVSNVLRFNLTGAVTKTLTLFPNPATAKVKVRGLETSAPADLRVIDLNGRVVLETSGIGANWEENGLDIGSLPAGMYHVEIVQNGQRTMLRMIKQ